MKKQRFDTSILKRASTIFLLIVLAASNVFAGSVTATWNKNIEPDIAGYKLFFGKTTGVYTDSIDVGNITTTEINDLNDRSKYFFAVTAYDSVGNESSLSKEVSKMVGQNLIRPGDGNGTGDFVIAPIDSATEYFVYKSKNPYSTFTDNLLTTLTSADSTFTDINKDSVINTGTYYKVKAKKNGQDYYEYQTVGEFNIHLRTGINLVSLPLIPGDSSLTTILSNQLTGSNHSVGADKIYVYNTDTGGFDNAWLFSNGSKLDRKWISGSGSQESQIKIKPYEAFWVELTPSSSDTIFTIAGVVEQDSNWTIELSNGYNFIGAPFPVEVHLNSSDLVKDEVMVGSVFSATADMIAEWTDYETFTRAWLFSKPGSAFDGMFFDEAGTGVTSITFKPGNGYVIWKKNQSITNIWTLPNPHPVVDDN
jgi:hypothetical protein